MATQDFIDGNIDRKGEDTTGTLYQETVADNTKIVPAQSALFSEEALDPYEVKHAKENIVQGEE